MAAGSLESASTRPVDAENDLPQPRHSQRWEPPASADRIAAFRSATSLSMPSTPRDRAPCSIMPYNARSFSDGFVWRLPS